MIKDEDIQKLVQAIVSNYLSHYWNYLKRLVNSKNIEGFPIWVVDPEFLVFYIGKNHIAIEYKDSGGSYRNKGNMSWEIHSLLNENNIFDHIVEIDYDGTSNVIMPITGIIENIFAPTIKADAYMVSSGWTIEAQMLHQSSMFAYNSSGFQFMAQNWASLRNCFFYGVDQNDKLITRHISWMDVFPIDVLEKPNGQLDIQITKWPHHEDLAKFASQYEVPELSQSKLKKLVLLNRFIELFNTHGIRETRITKYLTKKENQFIIKLAFGAKSLQSEMPLDWQSEPNRKSIRPDFFITFHDGYTDIVDFKLPTLKGNAIVGVENREMFSSTIGSHISQVINYQEYFEDPNNRQFVETNHNLKVYNPRAWLVIGRRDMLSGELLKKLQARYEQVEIKTYDDIVDSVKGHVYLVVED